MRAPLTCSRRLRPLSRKAGVLLVLVTVAAGCGGEDEPLASGGDVAAAAGTSAGSGGQAGGGAAGAAGAAGESAGAAGAAMIEGYQVWSGDDGAEYGLYLPGAAAGGQPPVVMYLHGCQGDPIADHPWFIEPLNEIEPTAVFFPKRPRDEGCSAWGGTYDITLRPAMEAALAELGEVMSERHLDDERQYLYGDSMGAEGVFKLLVEFPGRFAGAIAVAGYTLDTGADSMALTALWMFHGSEDTVNPTSSSRMIYQSILEAGGERVRYTEYPGLDHSSIWGRVPSEPDLCEWLLSQRRQP